MKSSISRNMSRKCTHLKNQAKEIWSSGF